LLSLASEANQPGRRSWVTFLLCSFCQKSNVLSFPQFVFSLFHATAIISFVDKRRFQQFALYSRRHKLISCGSVTLGITATI
jgi:hypothetical protein